MPFLQGLQEMPVPRRKYSIDDYLRRFGKALKHLVELKAFEEFLMYMAKHNLYKDGLAIYRYEEDKVRAIMRLYGEYLVRESRHKDAGIGRIHIYCLVVHFPTDSGSIRVLA